MSRLPPAGAPWTPTRIVAVLQQLDTSMGTTRVVTDATQGYLKTLGNREGPHCLASELVATALARWFGLTTADWAIYELKAEECVDLFRGARMRPGPAFISRHVPGGVLDSGGAADDLRDLENPDDITRLVVFDTWVRNCDRHPPDLSTRQANYGNVYLAATADPARRRLLAIDHTHCFDRGRELSPALAHIGNVRDDATYGLFPEFVGMISPGELAWCAAMLRTLSPDAVRGIVDVVPPAWGVPAAARAALVEFIAQRAAYLATRIEAGWTPRPAGTVAP